MSFTSIFPKFVSILFSIFSLLELKFLNSILYLTRKIYFSVCLLSSNFGIFFQFCFLDGCYHFFSPKLRSNFKLLLWSQERLDLCVLSTRQLQITQASVLVDSRKRLLQMYVILAICSPDLVQVRKGNDGGKFFLQVLQYILIVWKNVRHTIIVSIVGGVSIQWGVLFSKYAIW